MLVNMEHKISTALETGDFHTALPLLENMTSDQLSELTCTLPDMCTPLHYACRHGRVDIAQQLITHCKYSIESKDGKGRTPLHTAAQYGQVSTLKYLLHNLFIAENFSLSLKLQSNNMLATMLFQRKISDRHRDQGCNTPLHTACVHGQLDIVQLLTREIGCDSNDTNSEGLSCLHMAAQHGHLPLVRYLIEEVGSDMTLEDEHGRSPTYLAAGGGHLDILKYLIGENGADPHYTTSKKWKTAEFSMASGRSLVHTASRAGHLHVVRYLVEQHGCDPSHKDKRRVTPLYLACQQGHIDIVTFLTTEGKCDPCYIDAYGRTSFYVSCKGGHLEVVKYLVGKCHCDPFIPDLDDENPLTLLHRAAAMGQLKVVRYFSSLKNCNLLVKDNRSNTPLHHAALNGHLKIVQFFVGDMKCDPECEGQYQRTPLYFACQNGHIDIVKHLVEKHCCNPLCPDKNDHTPLHISAASGQLEIVSYFSTIIRDCRYLLIKDSFDNTPLHNAAFSGHLKVVKFFSEDMKCDPANFIGHQGGTPLHHASDGGHLDVVKYLVHKHKCNPLMKMSNGNTSLHIAVLRSHLDVVKFFIEEVKCDPNVQGHLKLRPLHFSLLQGYIDVSMYLIGLPHCDALATVTDRLVDVTPLYLAVRTQNLKVITYLCSTHRLDPVLQPNKEQLLQATSNTEILEYLKQYSDPLHTAAVYGDVETVRHYVEREKWCPKKFDRYGNNTLHNAAQHGRLEVVKYLTGLSKDPINEEVEILCDPQLKNKYGLTALEIASQNGHHHVKSYLLRTTIKSVLHQDVISSPLSIFVVGNSGSGKSTLVRALSSKSSLLGQFTKVKGVLPLTAGIVPTTLDSQVLGKVKIYDFAGHKEYYASHEMILGQTTQPLVLLTVDISLFNRESQVLKQLSYWLSILSNTVTADAQIRTIHIVIIGSHADQVKFQSRKQIHQDVTSLVSSGYSLKYHGFIQCDCRYSTSDNMKHLRQKLNTICKSVRLFLAHESDLSNKRCASLMYHIEHSMSKEITMTVNKLHKLITSSLTPGSRLVQFVDSELLLETCKTLSSNGHFFLLPHNDDFKESMLILNNEFILSKVHACLALIKKMFTNEIGILEENQLKPVLSELLEEAMESDLAIKYLIFAQFCTEVSSDQLLSLPANIRGASHFFFPNLVQASRPADLLSPGKDNLYTWCLKCSDSHHFFTPRYLHTLFIQLVKCQNDTVNVKFTVWRNGILLVHGNGTRSIIEVTDQSTQLYLTMQCMKGCESHLVKQRSTLITLIRALLVKVCPNVNPDEYFLTPHQVYPPICTAKVTIGEVACAVLHSDRTIPIEFDKGATAQQVLFEDLLYFDSFHIIEDEILRDILLHRTSKNRVSLAL